MSQLGRGAHQKNTREQRFAFCSGLGFTSAYTGSILPPGSRRSGRRGRGCWSSGGRAGPLGGSPRATRFRERSAGGPPPSPPPRPRAALLRLLPPSGAGSRERRAACEAAGPGRRRPRGGSRLQVLGEAAGGVRCRRVGRARGPQGPARRRPRALTWLQTWQKFALGARAPAEGAEARRRLCPPSRSETPPGLWLSEHLGELPDLKWPSGLAALIRTKQGCCGRFSNVRAKHLTSGKSRIEHRLSLQSCET